MSIDRLLAVILHLRYRNIVTVPRVFQTAVFLWVFMTTLVVLKFWIGYTAWIFLPLIILLLTLFVTTFSTFKIFRVVRRHQRQIINQYMAALNLQTDTVNVLKCRKSAVTVLYIYGLFLLLYLPFCVTMIVEAFSGYTKAVNVAYAFFESSCVLLANEGNTKSCEGFSETSMKTLPIQDLRGSQGCLIPNKGDMEGRRKNYPGRLSIHTLTTKKTYILQDLHANRHDKLTILSPLLPYKCSCCGAVKVLKQ